MKLLGLLVIVAVAQGVPLSQDESVARMVIGNFVNCVNSDLGLCLKEHALKATERLGTVRQLKLFDGVTIINNSPRESRSFDTLSSDPDVRRSQVTEKLWESTNNLIQNGELELSYAGGDVDDESRALGDVAEGRDKKKKEVKKKIKMLLPLAIIAKIKAIAISVFALLVIAASIYKLAVLAKIAFIIKAIAALKALLAKKNEQEDHGWAPAGHDDHGHGGHGGGGWDGGWSRSKNEANSLAYSAYQN